MARSTIGRQKLYWQRHSKLIDFGCLDSHQKWPNYRGGVPSVTNDLTQDSAEATREVCGLRWKIEQLHREVKQITGLESGQCRKDRIQCNHITRALPVWVGLTELASQTGKTIYKLKHGLLDHFLFHQPKHPALKMKPAEVLVMSVRL